MNIFDKKVAQRELNDAEWQQLIQIHDQAPIRYGHLRRYFPLETKEWCIESAKTWGEAHR
jgi:hypothetical protein